MNEIKSMKTLIKFAAVLLLSTVAAFSAIIPTYTDYATGGTALTLGTTNYWAVITAHSFNGAAPRITYLNANSDKAASKVQFFTSSDPKRVTFTNSTTTVYVDNTNGIAVNTLVLIVHTPSGSETYDVGRVASFSGTTNFVLYTAPTVTTVPGDNVYVQTAAGSILCQTNAINGGGPPLQKIDLSGPGLYTGLPGKPLLMMIDSTSAGAINAVNATFRP